MEKILSQAIVVENAANAGGATGSLRGKNATPDGSARGFGLAADTGFPLLRDVPLSPKAGCQNSKPTAGWASAPDLP